MSTYAVVWQDEAGSTHPGKLVVLENGLRLEGADHTRELGADDLAGIRIGRAAEERLGGRQTLIVESQDGGLLRISTLGEVGTLREVGERLASAGGTSPETGVAQEPGEAHKHLTAPA